MEIKNRKIHPASIIIVLILSALLGSALYYYLDCTTELAHYSAAEGTSVKKNIPARTDSLTPTIAITPTSTLIATPTISATKTMVCIPNGKTTSPYNLVPITSLKIGQKISIFSNSGTESGRLTVQKVSPYNSKYPDHNLNVNAQISFAGQIELSGRYDYHKSPFGWNFTYKPKQYLPHIVFDTDQKNCLDNSHEQNVLFSQSESAMEKFQITSKTTSTGSASIKISGYSLVVYPSETPGDLLDLVEVVSRTPDL